MQALPEGKPAALTKEAESLTDIRKSVRQIIRRCGCADPETICEKLNVMILEQDLPECVKGFTVRMNHKTFIVLNQELSFEDKRFTTAHELGHILLHDGTNSVLLGCHTSFCLSRYEKEADSFAAWLLMYAFGHELSGRECVTTEDIAKIAHIPQSVAENAFSESGGKL